MATAVGNWGNGPVWQITSGVFPSNAYFCEVDGSGGGLLIDPGLDGAAIDAQLAEHGLHPLLVVCTHGHFDHAGSAAYFQKKYGCQVFMHKADMRILKASNFLLMAFGIPAKIELPTVTPVESAWSHTVNGIDLHFIPTPGHTPGSCIIEFGRAWFSGDTIFSNGVGLSRLPGEDEALLKASILGLWDRLTRERMVFPGHGKATDGESLRSGNHALSKFLGLTE